MPESFSRKRQYRPTFEKKVLAQHGQHMQQIVCSFYIQRNTSMQFSTHTRRDIIRPPSKYHRTLDENKTDHYGEFDANAWEWIMGSSSFYVFSRFFVLSFFFFVCCFISAVNMKKELQEGTKKTMIMISQKERNTNRISPWPLDPDYKMQVLNTCIDFALFAWRKNDDRGSNEEINLATNQCESIDSIGRNVITAAHNRITNQRKKEQFNQWFFSIWL